MNEMSRWLCWRNSQKTLCNHNTRILNNELSRDPRLTLKIGHWPTKCWDPHITTKGSKATCNQLTHCGPTNHCGPPWGDVTLDQSHQDANRPPNHELPYMNALSPQKGPTTNHQQGHWKRLYNQFRFTPQCSFTDLSNS